MDPELEKRLKVIERKLDENTHLLSRIRRVQRNAGLFKLFYWLIIIGIAFGSFYYIAPFIKQLKDISGSTFKFSSPELNQFNTIRKQLQGSGTAE